MTQPTFSDGPPVPLMVEGHVDAPMLRRLFADLDAFATVLSVREKGGLPDYSNVYAPTIDVALARLLSGQIRALQVRYQFAANEWTDTMFCEAGGFRVVRCRHDPEK